MCSATTPDFREAHAKLNHAEEHLDTLNDEVQSFVGDSSYAQFEARLNPLDESYSVIFHEGKSLPVERWGLIVGDACHNMRCALNYVVCALVPPGQVHRRHQFPIFDSAQAWQSEFGGRRGEKMLDFVDAAHIAIIESAQPYQPQGLQRLSILERFSNADKHRLIHAVVTNLIDAPQISFSRVIPTEVTDVTYPQPGERVTDGTEIARFKADMALRLVPQPDGRVDILSSSAHVDADFQTGTLFGEPGQEDTRGREFRLTLEDIRSLVERF